jgi:helix-turn-helix protein
MNQIDILKAAFERGEELTVLEALTRYGVYALSQRVGELDRSGYPTEHEMVTLPNGKRIARYSKLKVAYG